eukprot:gene9503-biopygen1375
MFLKSLIVDAVGVEGEKLQDGEIHVEGNGVDENQVEENQDKDNLLGENQDESLDDENRDDESRDDESRDDESRDGESRDGESLVVGNLQDGMVLEGAGGGRCNKNHILYHDITVKNKIKISRRGLS